MPRRCPCHSRKLYKRCCQPLHEGRPAPSPLQLMRSRYSAYSLGLAEYISATSEPPQELEGVRRFCESTRFVGLQVHEHGVEGEEGHVRFTATIDQGAGPAELSEHSRFARRGAGWVYLVGVTGQSTTTG